MRVLPMTTPDEVNVVAETILNNVLADPEKRALIDKLVDDPEASRGELFGTAFAMGAVQAICEMKQGHVIQIGNSIQTQSKS